jgi:hypothetical protein
MNEKKHISYSAYDKYMSCPSMYDLHYNKRIRPIKTNTNLVFGSAVDAGIMSILDGDEMPRALARAAKKLLQVLSVNVDFEEKEFDPDLLTEVSTELVKGRLRRLGWQGDNVAALGHSLIEKRGFGETLTPNQEKSLRHLVYFSLLEKAYLMFEAFNQYVMPQIVEVEATQQPVKRGIYDFKAEFKGIGKFIVDVKTASRPYDEDRVNTSVQIIGYGAERAMYIVFDKNVKKNKTKVCSVCGNNGTGKRHKTCDAEPRGIRCGGEWNETVSPEVVPQIIFADIPAERRELVEKAYQDAEKAIELGCFPKNLNACGKQYGKPCPYINYCWSNDMAGLEKLDEKK